ncbi:MAG: type II toxin-antitoxin system Phd/YefM family antitoxin, partial [Micromonosporaceae bacterium]
LVRRAQAGEQVTITVAGRPAAMLGPLDARAWRRWDDIADIFLQPADEQWADDRDLLDHTINDPWQPR